MGKVSLPALNTIDYSIVTVKNCTQCNRCGGYLMIIHGLFSSVLHKNI